MNTTDVTWARLRDLVKRRDKSICFHCSKEADNGHCDHLIPISKGGTDAIENLVWSCKSCNISKGNKIISTSRTELIISEDEEVTNKVLPHFDRFFSGLIILLTELIIPPYPIYRKIRYHNDTHYYDVIVNMSRQKVRGWIREQIWTTPPRAKNIIDSSRDFDRIFDGFKWADKYYKNEREAYWTRYFDDRTKGLEKMYGGSRCRIICIRDQNCLYRIVANGKIYYGWWKWGEQITNMTWHSREFTLKRC